MLHSGMGRSGPLLLTGMLAAVGCSGRAGPGAESGPQQTRTAAAPAPREPAPAPARRPATPTEATRSVESGLAVGDKLEAFETFDSASGETSCQLCEYEATPKIIVAGTLDDPEFQEDIKDVDAIVAKWGRDRVKAFAVVAMPRDGRLSAPDEVDQELATRVQRLRKLLDVGIPIVIPTAEDGSESSVWEDHYNVTRSRTLIFADERDEVQYSVTAPDHLGPLDQAIREALGS